MADAKITDLDANTTPVSTDLLAIVDDPSGTAKTEKITLDNIDDYISSSSKTLTNKTLTSPIFQGTLDGWISANETWTYASADDPTFTFTIASFDATAKYSAGMKIKLTNSTVKYFIITKVVFDDPGSTITIYGGTDYDLVDAAITANYYSTQKAPHGFPLDPDKWTVEVTDATERNQIPPTQNTWYNLNNTLINIPIGSWKVNYNAGIKIYDAAGTSTLQGQITLSTANNSESDVDFTTYGLSSGGGITYIGCSLYREKPVVLATKDIYYLNIRTTSADVDAIYFANTKSKLIIRAICAYL